eukprot:UC1_evm1s1457
MMSVHEARKVLNVETTASWEEILEKYDKMFEMNDKKKGGSFYLQSKVYRAREALEVEMGE